MANHSGRGPAWTEAEREQLGRLIRQGLPIDTIARKLGRSANAIMCQHVLDRERTGVVFSREAVARLFGVDNGAVPIWQRNGWLPKARNGVASVLTGRRGKRSRAAYLITDTAIEAFVANRDTWFAWEPARITDPAWRALAESLRAQAAGRWLTTQEVADRLGVVLGTARMWHEKGLTDGLTIVRYGTHLYWWSADLDRWIQPGERVTYYGENADAAMAMARAGVTSTELAAARQIPLSVAARRLKLLMERGLLRRAEDAGRAGRYRYFLIEAADV